MRVHNFKEWLKANPNVFELPEAEQICQHCEGTGHSLLHTGPCPACGGLGKVDATFHLYDQQRRRDLALLTAHHIQH